MWCIKKDQDQSARKHCETAENEALNQNSSQKSIYIDAVVKADALVCHPGIETCLLFAEAAIRAHRPFSSTARFVSMIDSIERRTT